MRIEAFEAAIGPNVAVGSAPQVKHWKNWRELMETNDNSPGWMVQSPLHPKRAGRASRLKQTARTENKGQLDLRTLAKVIKLGENKIRILKLLRRADWIKILRLLPQHLLVNALRLFSKEKLLRLIMQLPKPLLIKVLLKIVKLETLIKKMPTNELMRILRSHKLNNRELTKGIMKLEPKFILLLLQRIYGNYDYSKLKPYDLFKIFMHTNKERLMEAFKTMPFKALQQLVSGFVKKDPELLFHMSDAFVLKLLEKSPKAALIKGCAILPPEILIRMLCQLPDPLLLLAAAQIDDKTFEDYLIYQHPDILSHLAGAA
jgi:hypothetical protein